MTNAPPGLLIGVGVAVAAVVIGIGVHKWRDSKQPEPKSPTGEAPQRAAHPDVEDDGC